MWIETYGKAKQLLGIPNSFASNGECGLKQAQIRAGQCQLTNSFASNGECGLKQRGQRACPAETVIHSPAMANVD